MKLLHTRMERPESVGYMGLGHQLPATSERRGTGSSDGENDRGHDMNGPGCSP